MSFQTWIFMGPYLIRSWIPGVDSRFVPSLWLHVTMITLVESEALVATQPAKRTERKMHLGWTELSSPWNMWFLTPMCPDMPWQPYRCWGNMHKNTAVSNQPVYSRVRDTDSTPISCTLHSERLHSEASVPGLKVLKLPSSKLTVWPWKSPIFNGN